MLQKNEIKIKMDFLEIISVYEEPANYVHVCPCCGSTEVVRNGTYERNIVFSKKGRISVKRVRMQRFLCKKCRRTRTHYPAFAVPGKEYSTGLLMAVIDDAYILGTGIPDEFNIFYEFDFGLQMFCKHDSDWKWKKNEYNTDKYSYAWIL